MWVPGNLPPNFVFLIMVTNPDGTTSQDEAELQKNPRDEANPAAGDEVTPHGGADLFEQK